MCRCCPSKSGRKCSDHVKSAGLSQPPIPIGQSLCNSKRVVTWLNLLERRNDGINGQNRGIVRNMQGYVKRWISLWPRRISALTLCQDNYAVLSKNLPANFPKNWSLAEATGQEESRTAERKSPRKTIRRWRSGSRLSADGIRDDKRQMCVNTDPSGDLNARDYGTMWWHNAWKAGGSWHSEAQRLFDNRSLLHC